MKQNMFILVGMPGAGKSCMGRILSSKLNMKLVDTDKLIEQKTGKPLQTLINELGVDAFRKIEEEVLLEVDEDNAIVSTGGSAVYSDKAMRRFNEKGVVIYLYCSYETIKERIGDFSKRGVVLKPGQDLKGLFDERHPLYKKYAGITVFCDGNAYASYQRDVIRAIKRCIK